MAETGSDSNNKKNNLPEHTRPKDAFSEKQFLHFIKHCPIPAAIFDRNMVYLACSDAHIRVFGLSSEEDVIGKNHYDISTKIFPEMPQRYRDAHQHAMQGFVVKNDNEQVPLIDGSIRYSRWECHPWYNTDGEVGGIILYSDVVTEQVRILKEAKEQTEQEKKQLEAILSNIDIGVVVVDMKGRALHTNDALVRILGFKDKSELPLHASIFEDLFQFLSYPERNEIPLDKWPLRKLFRGETVNKERCIIYHRTTGRQRIVEHYGTAIHNAKGDPELQLLMMTDISEQIEREKQGKLMQERMEQTQRLESLGVLAGGIAHDFNNLLMAILGHADIASLKLSEHSPVSENLSNIKTASLRATDLCTQLLAYSGQGWIEEKAFSINTLVSEMAQMLKTSISKNCALNLNLQDQLPLTVGDSSQMRQIVMNFVINASDAIGDHSGTINVSTDSMICPQHYFTGDFVIKPENFGSFVTLEVSDNGHGMDKETLGRIFEPFFTTKFTGRGLGLSAVLGILQSHGAGLRVDSEPESGTTFTVFFPINHNHSKDAPEGFEKSNTTRTHFSGRALLVDDEEIVRSVCSSQLEMLGIEVLVARNGMEGVEVYREKQATIDLVILDLTMPKMDGEKTFTILRQVNPEVKVILASGYAEQELTARFGDEKPSGYLRKPYTIEQLSSVLSDILTDRH